MNSLVKKEFKNLQANYFNSAYLGPLSMRSKQAGQSIIEELTNPFAFGYERWRPIPDQVRGKIGQLLQVDGDFISHHGSVSEVISTLATGFRFQKGDHVVVLDGDYPSNILPWMLNEERFGYKLEKLSHACFQDPELLKRSLPPQSKILNISHVQFNTGNRFDLSKIGRVCKELGVLFVVDVSQSLGGMPIPKADLDNIDVLIGVTYKWLLGSYGHAFAYWSQKALRQIHNTHLSWQTAASAVGTENLLNYSTDPLPGARRFDRGQAPNVVAMTILSKSIDLFLELGLENIQIHNKSLIDLFLSKFPREKYELLTSESSCANILCLKAKGISASDLKENLQSKGVDASVREGSLRLSFHFFNTLEEVERLTSIL